MQQNTLNFIGLMKRADKAVCGGENAYDAARNHKAKLFVLASDGAKNTLSQAKNIANQFNVPFFITDATKDELGMALGMRDCAAFAVTDVGFAFSLAEKCGQTEIADLLSGKLEREKRRRKKKEARQAIPLAKREVAANAARRLEDKKMTSTPKSEPAPKTAVASKIVHTPKAAGAKPIMPKTAMGKMGKMAQNGQKLTQKPKSTFVKSFRPTTQRKGGK